MPAPEKAKGFMGEFKAFIARGNVMDMAVGVIIGGAFGKISTSLVNDIIMPLISMLTGGIDFSNWKIVLKQAVAPARTQPPRLRCPEAAPAPLGPPQTRTFPPNTSWDLPSPFPKHPRHPLPFSPR